MEAQVSEMLIGHLDERYGELRAPGAWKFCMLKLNRLQLLSGSATRLVNVYCCPLENEQTQRVCQGEFQRLRDLARGRDGTRPLG